MEKIRQNVGRSSKTPYKHWLLDKELGRQAGIYSRPAAMRSTPMRNDLPLMVIDLCAGDGESSEFSAESSPAIISKHVKFAGGKLQAFMIEKNIYSFDALSRNVKLYGDSDNISLINGDALEFNVNIDSKQGVFINCDPNSVNEIPLTSEFIKTLPPWTTMIVTLGCNVAGLKRLSIDKRSGWFDYVNMVVGSLPRWHDALICSVTLDNSQWAYLVRLPDKWSSDSKASYIKSGAKMFKHGVTVYSYRRERPEFNEQIKRLFLTKKEYANENT